MSNKTYTNKRQAFNAYIKNRAWLTTENPVSGVAFFEEDELPPIYTYTETTKVGFIEQIGILSSMYQSHYGKRGTVGNTANVVKTQAAQAVECTIENLDAGRKFAIAQARKLGKAIPFKIVRNK